MNWRSLLIKMLPGLIPLFIFIIADEIWGTEIGLIVAIAVGILELIVIWIKERRLEKFVIIDTLLIMVMGGVSLLLDNAIFFKMKPAIIEAILCIIIGVSAFSGKNIILKMSQRYMKGIDIKEQQQKLMTRSLKAFFWILLVHTLLITYSAFYMSKEAWVFISGGLFYIILGLYMIGMIFQNRMKAKSFKIDEDILPEINEEGKIIGRLHRTEAHDGSKRLHPVVHLHVFNTEGKMLFQQRKKTKKIQPGKWDTAVGGHVSFGENIETALQREALEELGINGFQPKLFKRYIWESEIEKELVFSFVCVHNGPFKIQESELDGVEFFTADDIKRATKNNILTPNLIHELNMLAKEGVIK